MPKEKKTNRKVRDNNMTSKKRKILNDALKKPYLNDENKPSTSANACISNEEDDVRGIITKNQFLKIIDQYNKDPANRIKPTEIEGYQKINIRPLFIQKNVYVNWMKKLNPKKNNNQFNFYQAIERIKTTVITNDKINMMSNQPNNNNQILIQQDVKMNNECRLLQSTFNSDFKENQELKNDEIDVDQVENGNCIISLTTEESNFPLLVKVVEPKNIHRYRSIMCDTSLFQTKDNKNHNKIYYMCDKCYLKYVTHGLEPNKKSSMIKESYKCLICKLKFEEESSLDEHLKEAHFKTKNIMNIQSHGKFLKCQNCEFFIFEPLLQSHQCTNSGKSKNTLVCFKTYLYEELLREFNNSVLSDERAFKCEICNQSFSKKSKLYLHKMTHEEIITYECCSCGIKFDEKSKIIFHEKNHSTKKQNKRGTFKKKSRKNSISKKLLEKHEKKNSFTCDECNLVIIGGQSSLIDHLMIHAHSKVFTCTICPLEFVTSSQLIRHLKTHVNEKSFQCDICSKQFNLKSTLKNHKKNHTHDKSHVSDTLSTHTKTKPLNHPISLTHDVNSLKHIKKNTYKKSNQSKMRLTYHKNLNYANQFQCNTCKLYFSRKCKLIPHMKKHFCYICNRMIMHAPSTKYPENNCFEKCSTCQILF